MKSLRFNYASAPFFLGKDIDNADRISSIYHRIISEHRSWLDFLSLYPDQLEFNRIILNYNIGAWDFSE